MASKTRKGGQSPKTTSVPENRLSFILNSIVAGAALLYAVLNPEYRTGVINDDAVFVLGARSLINKSVFPSLVLRPDYPLPGLPLLLAPMAKFVAPDWISLEWLAVLAMVLSVYLLGQLARKLPSQGESIAVVALFAFNPVVAQFSGILMPSAFYTAALIGSYLLMDDLLQKRSTKKALALGIILGWASLLRPEGVLLLISIVATLALMRKGRECLHVVAIPITFWLLILAYWWHILRGNQTEYGGDLTALASYWSHHALSGIHFFSNMLHDLFINSIITISWSSELASSLLTGIIVIFCLFAVAIGFRKLWEEQIYPRPVLLSAGIFSILYFLVHVFWHVAQPRYAIPLLPFLLIFLVRGAHELAAPFRRQRVWTGAALILVLLTYTYKNGLAAYESLWAPDPMKSPPWRSLAWLDHNTPADVKMISNIAPNIELYANRPALSGLSASNFEMFLYRLKRRKLKYIVERNEPFLTPGVAGTENPNASLAQTQLWASHYPQKLPLVFEDSVERIKVFHVVHQHGFKKAYKILESAYQNYRDNNLDEAFRLVNNALTIYPNLGSATNLLGAIYMKQNDLKNAERAFLKTVDLLPDAANALVNLATLYNMRGETERARDYIQRALDISAVNGDRDEWNRKIEELYRHWVRHEGLIFTDSP